MINFADQPGGRIDSANHFEVVEVKAGNGVKVLNPPAPDRVLTKSEAVNLAAWLMAMAGAKATDLLAVLAEIAKK